MTQGMSSLKAGIARQATVCVEWFRFAFKFVRLLDAPLWRAADRAVLRVMQHHELQKVSKNEEQITFCPRCGQMPDGDRRLEEAREILLAEWRGTIPRRSELDFALAWAYFRRKL